MMRILWLANTSGNLETDKSGYNGGGWISSLQTALSMQSGLELAITFETKKRKQFKINTENCTYYPVLIEPTFMMKLNMITGHIHENKFIKQLKNVIEDYRPDIIEVFGSERGWGQISKYTNVPVVLHIQGVINPYLNALLIPGFNKMDFYTLRGLSPKKIVKQWYLYRIWKYQAKREFDILQLCKYYMGRTEWDKEVVTFLSPDSTYFYCSEMLRPVFIESKEQWFYKENREKRIFISTISAPIYKGLDVVLKVAKLLKEKIDFEWHIYGINQALKGIVNKTGIKPEDVNVILCGIVDAELLREVIVNCDVYVHPSYIENSPNSVCEAQILGVPVVASNVGGVSSLITHCETGVLIPANDPYFMAAWMFRLCMDSELSKHIGFKAKQLASKRHDPQLIVKSILDTYQSILNNI